MHKVIILCLLTIHIALGKHKLIITQIKNDVDVPVRSRLVTAPIGANLTFHCKVKTDYNHSVIDTAVKWITTPSDYFKLAENDSSKLLLSPLQISDAGSYTCISKKQKLFESFRLVVKPRHAHDLTSNSDGLVRIDELTDNRKFIDDLVNQERSRKLFDRLSKESMEFPKDLFTKVSQYPKFLIEPKFNPNFDERPIKDWDDRLGHSRVFSNTTYSNFKQSVYIVPVTILVMLGFVRLCYHIRNKSGIPWQTLNTPVCSHQLCAHRRRSDPSAICVLQRANSNGLSVLIIHRETGAGDDQSNNQVDETDAPPAYNELNCNDSPPTYNEALQNINTDTSTVTENAAATNRAG